jgi:polar amino acid transport system substrate-binding protein
MIKIIIFLLAIGIMNGQPVSAQAPLQLVSMNFKSLIWCEEGTAKGITADIVAEVFHRVDRPYSIACVPWERALAMVKDGTADGVILGYKTHERENFGIFPNTPIQLSRYSVFVQKGQEFPFETIEDLYGKTIGIDRGHTISPEFDRAVSNGDIIVEEAANTEYNLRKLLAGRFDAYVNNHHVILYMANQLKLSERIIALNHPLVKPTPSYLWFSKAADIPDKDVLIQQVNQVLTEMWKDGTVERITSQYIQ